MRVTCPSCQHSFDAPERRNSTLRSLAPVRLPIRDNDPTCARCGFVQGLHEGQHNLALAKYGCTEFLPKGGE